MKKRSPTNSVRTFYTYLDALFASPVAPMPETTRQSWLTRVYLALEAIERAPSPTKADWRILSDVVNLMETMLVHGIVADEDGIKERGKAAMAIAGARYLEGKRMGFDGAGIQAMRALIADMGEIMAQLPHREIVKVHVATEKRIAEIVRGKVKAGDVVVAV